MDKFSSNKRFSTWKLPVHMYFRKEGFILLKMGLWLVSFESLNISRLPCILIPLPEMIYTLYHVPNLINWVWISLIWSFVFGWPVWILLAFFEIRICCAIEVSFYADDAYWVLVLCWHLLDHIPWSVELVLFSHIQSLNRYVLLSATH